MKTLVNPIKSYVLCNDQTRINMADNYIEKRNEQYASQKAAWMNKSSFARKRAMERMRKRNAENEAKIKEEVEKEASTPTGQE